MNCKYCPLPLTSEVTLASSCGGASFLLFMGILETFIRKQCDLQDPCHRVLLRNQPNPSYDFVVIGAGSAGAVVASRLSEMKGFSVLLLEAGLEEPAWTQVPSLFYNSLHTKLDWQYVIENEENECSYKNDDRCYWGKGKVLGGTSSINGMMYMRGSQKDYNDWEKLGNKGWSFRDVLPFFKKSENNLQMDKVDSGYHGTGGPLPVVQFNYHPPMNFEILKAVKELGYDIVDLNGKNHTGFAITQSTSNKGSRFSSARAFLRPALNRRNLHIMINSTATKIIFDDNKTAVAVEFYKNGKIYRVGIGKEVIISGGIVNSPQILLNSGIGSREELETVGVPVIHDLPGVGKNLHDHVFIRLTFSINETDVNSLNWASAMEYLLYRQGPLSGTGLQAVSGFINTKYANLQDDNPDVQLLFAGYLADCSENGTINKNSESRTSRRKFSFIPVVIRPKSKGYLRLKNNDPLSKPLINPKYLSHPHDIAVLIEGIKFALRLAETNALRKYDIQLDKSPVENCEHFEFGSDSYWECAVKRDRIPGNHQAGSCKMGPDSDPLAVVDHKLRVKGVKGVRVADTSIIPDFISGNFNAPAIMIGERAADFIKKKY